MENKTISFAEAQKILGVSKSRISTLLKEGRIGEPGGEINYKLVLEYKKTRKPGRPIGSYKK